MLMHSFIIESESLLIRYKVSNTIFSAVILRKEAVNIYKTTCCDFVFIKHDLKYPKSIWGGIGIGAIFNVLKSERVHYPKYDPRHE